MSGLDKNRLRNKTISFWVSPEEALQLEARIKVCGIPKREYFIRSLLYNNIAIAVGKYQSDRLSLELSRLREELHRLGASHNFFQALISLQECKVLLDEILKVTAQNDGIDELKVSDLQSSSEFEENLPGNSNSTSSIGAGKRKE